MFLGLFLCALLNRYKIINNKPSFTNLFSFSVSPSSFSMLMDLHLSICFRLKIAFKWLMRAFSGYLGSDQLLLLWDRILAYGSVDLLASKYMMK